MELFFPKLLTLSHARLKVWRRCPMQHHYRYYQGLRKIRNGVPLFTGTGVHAMLEAYHETGNWQPVWKQFKSDFGKLFKEEQAELGDLPERVKAIVENYLATYPKDGLTYPKRRRNRSTELPISVNLDTQTRFVGFIDAYPVDAKGRNWIMDHKTCKTIPDEESRFSDLQLLIYVWLVPQLGYPVPDGVIWDYIRTKAPSIPPVLKNGQISRARKIDTTQSVYLATVERELGKEAVRDYEEFSNTLFGREAKFYRRIMLPSPSKTLVSNIVDDIRTTGESIRNATDPENTVRVMTKDCKQCTYYNLCQAEVRGLDSTYIRKAEFTVQKDHHGYIEKKADDADGSDEPTDEAGEAE